MTIRTTDTNEIIKIELRSFDGLNWSPDCFDDLGCNFAMYNKMDDDFRVLASRSDVDAEIAWWQAEIERANADPDYEGEGLCASYDGSEYSLFVDIKNYTEE